MESMKMGDNPCCSQILNNAMNKTRQDSILNNNLHNFFEIICIEIFKFVLKTYFVQQINQKSAFYFKEQDWIFVF